MDFKYSDDNKRYHTLAFFNKQKYGSKVYKASINANLSCPNIDGTKGVGGCIYCDGGSEYFTDKSLSIKEQIEKEILRINKNGADNKIIVYYQSNTNTYTTVEKLRNMLETALEFENVVGVTLSTRTDCLSKEKLELLSLYNQKTNIALEFGLQTIHNKTLEFINRCQTFENFLEGFYTAKEYAIPTCIHIINGLPFETREMMLDTAKKVGKLNPDGLKIHMLHITSGTLLEKIYNENPFHLLSREEYVEILCKQLEYIPQKTVIERVTGDGDKRKLVAPEWTADKIATLGSIDKRMAQLDTYQGKLV